jgi:hypothetical protein
VPEANVPLAGRQENLIFKCECLASFERAVGAVDSFEPFLLTLHFINSRNSIGISPIHNISVQTLNISVLIDFPEHTNPAVSETALLHHLLVAVVASLDRSPRIN